MAFDRGRAARAMIQAEDAGVGDLYEFLEEEPPKRPRAASVPPGATTNGFHASQMAGRIRHSGEPAPPAVADSLEGADLPENRKCKGVREVLKLLV